MAAYKRTYCTPCGGRSLTIDKWENIDIPAIAPTAQPIMNCFPWMHFHQACKLFTPSRAWACAAPSPLLSKHLRFSKSAMLSVGSVPL